MIWTHEKPTRPGYYWWRGNNIRARVVEVIEFGHLGCMRAYGTFGDDMMKDPKSQWSDRPVEEPVDP